MSKQFYIAKTVENAHETDIFSVAVTPNCVVSGSGASTLRFHSTESADYPIIQSIDVAHKLGCHHVATAKGGTGRVACSIGFGGELKVWRRSEAGDWTLADALQPRDLATPAAGEGDEAASTGSRPSRPGSAATAGDAWALALSTDEKYLAYTTHNGNVGVWDLEARSRLLVFRAHNRATSSFAMSVALSQDGRYTAAGFQSGAVNVFSNDASKLLHTLPGLGRPVRSVAFSPLGKLLAAGGDAGVISLYDVKHGEPIGNLSPVTVATTNADGSSTTSALPWVMSLDFSATGEYLLAGYMDGKVRVWNVEKKVCVATNSDSDMATLWGVQWLPPQSERPGADTASFCTVSADCRLTFYREAGSATNP